MTKTELHRAIRERFESTVIAAMPDLPVSWPNHEIDKPENETWVDFAILDGESNQVSFGPEKRHRMPGVISIRTYTPMKKGTEDLDTVEELVTKHFRSKKIGDVTYRTVSGRNVGRDQNWFVRVIDIGFYADSFDSDFA